MKLNLAVSVIGRVRQSLRAHLLEFSAFRYKETDEAAIENLLD